MMPLRPGRAVSLPRLLAVVGGVALVAGSIALAPQRLALLVPAFGLLRAGQAADLASSPYSSFNLDLVVEMRASLLLVGSGLALVGLLGPRLGAWLERLSPRLLALDRWLQQGRRWSVILAGSVILVAVAFAAYSSARHAAFNSKAYDLGLHAQVTWNTSQGRLFASSVEVNNYLGDHFSPVILLLAPLYRIWPDPRSLLAVQALALSAGALPLAWLTRRLLRPVQPEGAYLVALLLALIYLSYPALGFVNRFEFHEEVLAVPLLLLAYWFLETRRPWAMSASLGLALLCKEDVGLTVAAFGLFAWWRTRRFDISGRAPAHANRSYKLGLAWFLIGLAWSLVALFVIIPAFRGQASDTLSRYAWLGQGPAEVLTSLARDPLQVVRHLAGEPRRLWFLAKLLLPVGFLPLLSPAVLVGLPSLAVNWLAGNLYQSSPYFHYATMLIPVVFAAAVYGMARLAATANGPTGTEGISVLTGPASADRRLTPLVLWLLACAALGLAFDQFWQRQVGPDDWENYGLEQVIDPAPFREAAALLPADARVATTEAYAPHLANRKHLYLLHDPRLFQVVERVDWVLVDMADHRYGVEPKLYYALLRWVADQRSLEACYFASTTVLLGRDCGSASAAAAYRAELAARQQAVSAQQLAPELVDRLGSQYFQAETTGAD